MAMVLPVVIFMLCVTVVPLVSADDCKSYTDEYSQRRPSKECGYLEFCCGSCDHRYCCQRHGKRLSESEQEDCDRSNDFNFSSFDDEYTTATIASSIAGFVILSLLFISCCVCPCCCLYKMCRKPTPVIATTTHTTVTTSAQYPQQPVASAGQGYQAVQYPAYQPVPVQPGYGAQPMPTAPYQGQPYMPGPPPPYQEATAGYGAPPMPYSQAAFSPGHAPYPLQPPAQPGQQTPQQDPHSTQPAYNPAYNPAYAEPPKTGY